MLAYPTVAATETATIKSIRGMKVLTISVATASDRNEELAALNATVNSDITLDMTAKVVLVLSIG